MVGTDVEGVALKLIEWSQGATVGALPWTELLDRFPQGADDASVVFGLAHVGVALTVMLMNALSQAVFVVDAKGCVLLLNRLATELLQRTDALTIFNGVLCAVAPSTTAALHRLITKAGEPPRFDGGRPPQALRLESPRGDGPLPVLVNALPKMRWAQPYHPAAAVLVGASEPDSEIDPGALQRWYGLTPAEARVAALLAKGRTVEEVAKLLGVQSNTVRVQLREVFAKTGTNRQADLVRLLATLPRLPSATANV